MEPTDNKNARPESDGSSRLRKRRTPAPKPLANGKPAATRQLAQQPGVAKPRLRIVVVDDNRDTADSLSMLLRAWGHEVTTTYDGRSGLDLILQLRPDAALLDIGLPGLSGYQVAEELAKAGAVPAVLAAISGYGQQADVDRARAAGFHFHFVKPAHPEDVAKVLEYARRSAP